MVMTGGGAGVGLSGNSARGMGQMVAVSSSSCAPLDYPEACDYGNVPFPPVPVPARVSAQSPALPGRRRRAPESAAPRGAEATGAIAGPRRLAEDLGVALLELADRHALQRRDLLLHVLRWGFDHA